MAFELLPLKPEQHAVAFIPRVSLELPFFNLTSRRKDIPKVIRYQGRDDAGRPIRWEVYQDASSEIGAPSVEAHEVWYLLVKPCIDISRRADGTIRQIIPLGGLRECLRKVGWTAGGYQARELIKALTQIAFAGCVADLWIPTGEHDEEGKEKFLQVKGRFSRMSVYAIGEHHLTEEELAQSTFDFDLEDMIYIRLDPLEAKLQQLQDRRILDNQYLFSVRPAARRWYELMAAKLFGVVKNKGQFCEMRYSWYLNHHHTLKRYYQRFRVVEQMNRVVKDHLESGYISKVEYRVLKVPDQELDYIIRYYPGPAAGQSIDRIQAEIKNKRARKFTRRLVATSERGQEETAGQIKPTLTLSLISAEDTNLMTQLAFSFGVNLNKAYVLILTKKEAVRLQLDAWRFRDVKPRNLAGWMIQAIENNYDAPPAYFDDKENELKKAKIDSAREAVSACPLCDNAGFRYFKSAQYPNGAMRQCSHEPKLEAGYENSDSQLSSRLTSRETQTPIG